MYIFIYTKYYDIGIWKSILIFLKVRGNGDKRHSLLVCFNELLFLLWLFGREGGILKETRPLTLPCSLLEGLSHLWSSWFHEDLPEPRPQQIQIAQETRCLSDENDSCSLLLRNKMQSVRLPKISFEDVLSTISQHSAGLFKTSFLDWGKVAISSNPPSMAALELWVSSLD